MSSMDALPKFDARAQFDEEGYLIIKGILDQKTVQRVRRDLATLAEAHIQTLLQQGVVSDPKSDLPLERRLIEVLDGRLEHAPGTFRKELHMSGFYDVFFNPIVLDIVEQFLGPEIRLYPNYSARPKLPESEATLVLWHQDGGYTDQTVAVNELRMVNLWTPLVPATVETGCMEFVPGTHKLGVVPHVKKRYYLEIAEEHLKPYEGDAIPIELDPGDVVLFHNLLYHRGLPNRSQIIRWNLDWRYQDATQPTLREQQGHMARSKQRPEAAVQSAEDWVGRSFV